jgi:hypothetical protein
MKKTNQTKKNKLIFNNQIYLFTGKKKKNAARHCWLTLAILATHEVEIRRILIQSQPGKIVCKTLS